MGKRLGIYIHIPFCASKCSYCDFYSLAGCDHLMTPYHEALIKHIKESAQSVKNYEIDSVYFGGGTPSYYGADRIADILNILKLGGNLRLDAEISVECNPDSITLRDMKLLREQGVNRLSFGVQASDNDLLKLIGRRHNFQQAQLAVQNARLAGFSNVSIDLMYGLPSQTKRDWTDTLARAVAMHPEHISCYGLKLEKGTRMYSEYKDSPVLPDDDEQADMYCYAAEMLGRYGYKQYEISNFAVPGFESRHNLKYWELGDYLGFGPGAHSCIGNARFSYVHDLKQYISCVNRGSSIVDEYSTIDALERSVEYIMLSMRTVKGISEHDYRLRCQGSWEPVHKALMAFRQKGWAVMDEDGHWHFTVSGFLISNTLIGILLEAQASGRIDNIPWLEDAFEAEEKTQYPKGEDELFKELYDQTVKTE